MEALHPFYLLLMSDDFIKDVGDCLLLLYLKYGRREGYDKIFLESFTF